MNQTPKCFGCKIVRVYSHGLNRLHREDSGIVGMYPVDPRESEVGNFLHTQTFVVVFFFKGKHCKLGCDVCFVEEFKFKLWFQVQLK